MTGKRAPGSRLEGFHWGSLSRIRVEKLFYLSACRSYSYILSSEAKDQSLNWKGDSLPVSGELARWRGTSLAGAWA